MLGDIRYDKATLKKYSLTHSLKKDDKKFQKNDTHPEKQFLPKLLLGYKSINLQGPVTSIN